MRSELREEISGLRAEIRGAISQKDHVSSKSPAAPTSTIALQAVNTFEELRDLDKTLKQLLARQNFIKEMAKAMSVKDSKALMRGISHKVIAEPLWKEIRWAGSKSGKAAFSSLPNICGAMKDAV